MDIPSPSEAVPAPRTLSPPGSTASDSPSFNSSPLSSSPSSPAGHHAVYDFVARARRPLPVHATQGFLLHMPPLRMLVGRQVNTPCVLRFTVEVRQLGEATHLAYAYAVIDEEGRGGGEEDEKKEDEEERRLLPLYAPPGSGRQRCELGRLLGLSVAVEPDQRPLRLNDNKANILKTLPPRDPVVQPLIKAVDPFAFTLSPPDSSGRWAVHRSAPELHDEPGFISLSGVDSPILRRGPATPLLLRAGGQYVAMLHSHGRPPYNRNQMMEAALFYVRVDPALGPDERRLGGLSVPSHRQATAPGVGDDELRRILLSPVSMWDWFPRLPLLRRPKKEQRSRRAPEVQSEVDRILDRMALSPYEQRLQEEAKRKHRHRWTEDLRNFMRAHTAAFRSGTQRAGDRQRGR